MIEQEMARSLFKIDIETLNITESDKRYMVSLIKNIYQDTVGLIHMYDLSSTTAQQFDNYF